MSNGPAGMGGSPGWLSDRTLARIRASEASEAAQAKRDEQAAAARREDLHQRAVGLWMQQAADRGENISVQDVAAGFGGRSIDELRESARAQSAIEDARDAAREQREGGYVAHVFVAEPTIIGPANEARRSILNRSRRWREWQASKAAAEAARAALEDENRVSLANPVELGNR